MSTRRPSSRVPLVDVVQSAPRTGIANRAQQETGSSAARTSTLEGANIVALSKPHRPLKGTRRDHRVFTVADPPERQ